MLRPSLHFNRLVLIVLFFVTVYIIWVDYHFYSRILNSSKREYIEPNINETYWFGCDFSPICHITCKSMLLDHTNSYVFSPMAVIIDRTLHITETLWITPNMISVSHIFVAIVSAKCVSNDNLGYRRIGVMLFQFRTILDELDGQVARARKHVVGEKSEVGTAGYWIDGICDGFGCIALIIGCFVFLKNNPPRRGYLQLPTHEPCDTKEVESKTYKNKTTTKDILKILLLFSIQVIINTTAWNRYIATYQTYLENNDVSNKEYALQESVIKSFFFLSTTWIWRIVNFQNYFTLLLLAIFFNKMWEMLYGIAVLGYLVLLIAISLSEIHIAYMKSLFREVII